jgi:hypothetical protein
MLESGDFDAVASKFRWAQRQIAELDLAVTDYVSSHPYVSVVEDQRDAQAYKVTARLRYPPPGSIAHIVGDVLNSLHGTLDYLAWQLALRENATPDHLTAFPIIESPNSDGSEPQVNVYRAQAQGRGRVAMLDDVAVIDVLRKVQPFHGSESERGLSPLVLLRKLNRDSKHRHPAVVTSSVDQGHYLFVTPTPWGATLPEGVNVAMVTTNFTPLHDGDEMAWVPYLSVPEDGLPEYDDLPTFVSLEKIPTYPRTGLPFPVVEAMADIAMFIERHILRPIGEIF